MKTLSAEKAALAAIAALAETRDQESGNHILRVQLYTEKLAHLLREHRGVHHELDDAAIEILGQAAVLHDIGKIAIPDRILLHDGRLDRLEFEIMKLHAQIGADTIEKAELRLGEFSPLLNAAREIALSHHEYWDGSGYPQGLKGEEIPLGARLVALADVYDALIHRRIYKPAFPHHLAVEQIAGLRGIQFDPEITDVFLAHAEAFLHIAKTYADPFQMPG